MPDAPHHEPVAAESFGDAAPTGGTSLAPSSWLLELGSASRNVESRVAFQQNRGHPIRAWNWRRAGARARRDLVMRVFAAAVVPLAEPIGPAGWDDTAGLPALVVVEEVALPQIHAEEPEAAVEPEQESVVDERPDTALLARIGAYTGSSVSVR